MQIIRTVPVKIPEGRNYVVDQIDKVEVQNYDMHFLTEINDDVILLEWDIVVAQHDLINFITHARMAPTRVHVAPYVLYPESLDEIVAPVWAHREMTNEMPLQLRWVDYGEPVCDIFSTGMVYLPKEVVNRIDESDDLITWHYNITDSKLAFWYHQTFKEKVPIHWDVRPIHLHYGVDDIYEQADIRRHQPRRPTGHTSGTDSREHLVTR